MSFSNSVSNSDSVSLEADVEVDPRHIGEHGGIYVLIGLKGQGLFQLNQLGELEEWDGTVEGLIAFGGQRSLRKLEHLTIMDGFRLGSAFSNQQLSVYVAYWVESSGELVYTGSRSSFVFSNSSTIKSCATLLSLFYSLPLRGFSMFRGCRLPPSN